MNTVWMMETHGEPLVAIHQFVQEVWKEAGLEGVYVSGDLVTNNGKKAHFMQDPQEFEQVNPFRPGMTMNAAKLIPAFLREHPQVKAGVLLRPCEMRALTEMRQRKSFPSGQMLTLSVDCLGTYPAEDVQWRAERKGSVDGLANEALHFARQGGIAHYRYRTACQVCRSPAADAADINIGVLGIPARQHLLVETLAEDTALRLHFNGLGLQPARRDLVEQREKVLAKAADRHLHTRRWIIEGVANRLPANLETLAVQLEKCSDCQECMNACPICSMEFPNRDVDGHYNHEDLAHWLVSCAGCGMCEQACSKHLPLSAIFGYIRSQLEQQVNSAIV